MVVFFFIYILYQVPGSFFLVFFLGTVRSWLAAKYIRNVWLVLSAARKTKTTENPLSVLLFLI